MVDLATGQAPLTGSCTSEPVRFEDCLYLDVKAPQEVFDDNVNDFPLLVWIDLRW